ncbi:hypothetical protein [Campylobacter blaseri]|nr:hypothetical protein [Campylobacter blaseri]
MEFDKIIDFRQINCYKVNEYYEGKSEASLNIGKCEMIMCKNQAEKYAMS